MVWRKEKYKSKQLYITYMMYSTQYNFQNIQQLILFYIKKYECGGNHQASGILFFR